VSRGCPGHCSLRVAVAESRGEQAKEIEQELGPRKKADYVWTHLMYVGVCVINEVVDSHNHLSVTLN